MRLKTAEKYCTLQSVKIKEKIVTWQYYVYLYYILEQMENRKTGDSFHKIGRFNQTYFGREVN